MTISFDREYFKFLKFQNCEMGSRGLLRKTLRKPTEAYGSLRKPTESLRKSYGNFGEIQWRNPTEILRKTYGNMRKQHAEASTWKLEKVRNLIEFYPAEAIFTMRKPYRSPAEGLQKPCGRLFRKSDLVQKLPQVLIYNIAPLHPSSFIIIVCYRWSLVHFQCRMYLCLSIE